MKHTIFLLAILATLLPTPAYACSGFVDCLFGFTERTEVRADRDIELERIQAQRDAQVADIEAAAQERVRQAEAEVERVRQQRFETEAQRDVAIAEAQAQAEQYRAMVAALTDEKIAGINANAQTQIVALQEQTKIGLESITQTGITERWRIGGGWTFAIVCVLIIGALLRILINRQRDHVAYVRMVEGRNMHRIHTDQRPYIEAGRQGNKVVRYEE